MTRLIKGKPLDNMEFLQWLKIYHDQVTSGAGILEYNAEERRALSKGGNDFMKASKSEFSPPSPSLSPKPHRKH